MSAKYPLRVWWIPQIPMDPFFKSVNDLREAKLLLETLADYDNFQYENKIKPDYSNSGGLQVFKGDDWEEWYNDFGESIEEVDENGNYKIL